MEAPGVFWAWDESKFRAGRIVGGHDFWKVIVCDPALDPVVARNVLEWTSSGIDVPHSFRKFVGKFGSRTLNSLIPEPYDCRANLPLTGIVDGAQWVRSEIDKLLARGSIMPVTAKPHVVLPLGVVETSKRRLIYDARYLNLWCPSPDMSYETLEMFARNVEADDLLFNVDHTAGYHHVPLTERSWKYFGFRWEEQLYVWRVLPFGWAPACYIYNTLSSVLAAHLRRQALRLLYYIDDFGFAISRALPPAERYRRQWIVLAAMYCAYFVIAKLKSMLELSTSLKLLGFIVDSKNQQFHVPEDKLRKILDALHAAIGAGGLSFTALQSLVGKLQSLSKAAAPVSLYLRDAYQLLAVTERTGRTYVLLSPEVVADFKSLLALKHWSGLSRWRSEVHVRLETDASKSGWCGYLFIGDEVLSCSGRFSAADSELPIHVLEMFATCFTLRRYGHVIRDCQLDAYVDNEVLRFSMNKGSVDKRLTEFARDLLMWQLQNNVVVRPLRITTEENYLADQGSRGLKAVYSDYCLRYKVFRQLEGQFGPFTIDACASAASAMLPRYVAAPPTSPDVEPDRMAVAVNVFFYRFQGSVAPGGPAENIYCFPPFALIAAIWRHFRLQRCKGVLIYPEDSMRSWFPSVHLSVFPRIKLAAASDCTSVFVLRSSSRVAIRLKFALWAVNFDFSSVVSG